MRVSAFLGAAPKVPALLSVRLQSVCPHRRRPVDSPRMQTWSDPAVTREYMDFLSGKAGRAPTKDGPCVIIGASGRIGGMLSEAGNAEDVIVARGEKIPPDAPGPVYVCTRADALEDIIVNCPDEKREDLVFMQNGMLEPLLRRHNVHENTRVNLYLAVSSVGAKPIDGVTASNPEGLTSVTGKWADAFAERLGKLDLSCKILFERDFRRGQLEKLIWISAFNLVGAVHGGVSMGQVAEKHRGEIDELVAELGTMIRFTLAVGMMSDVEKRLCDYARTVASFPTALKEFQWRNGWFYNYSCLAKKNGIRDYTPMHTGYLEDGKKMGVIDW
jgi:hypothetical protein